jgi:flagellin-specific chaperone FliS
MLIDAALRHARQARELWTGDRAAEARVAACRAQTVVGEMLCSLDLEAASTPSRSLAELYAFVLRTLAEAIAADDLDLLGDALRLLEYERETWLTLCQRRGAGAQVVTAAGGFALEG